MTANTLSLKQATLHACRLAAYVLSLCGRQLLAKEQLAFLDRIVHYGSTDPEQTVKQLEALLLEMHMPPLPELQALAAASPADATPAPTPEATTAPLQPEPETAVAAHEPAAHDTAAPAPSALEPVVEAKVEPQPETTSPATPAAPAVSTAVASASVAAAALVPASDTDVVSPVANSTDDASAADSAPNGASATTVTDVSSTIAVTNPVVAALLSRQPSALAWQDIRDNLASLQHAAETEQERHSQTLAKLLLEHFASLLHDDEQAVLAAAQVNTELKVPAAWLIKLGEELLVRHAQSATAITHLASLIAAVQEATTSTQQQEYGQKLAQLISEQFVDPLLPEEQTKIQALARADNKADTLDRLWLCELATEILELVFLESEEAAATEQAITTTTEVASGNATENGTAAKHETPCDLDTYEQQAQHLSISALVQQLLESTAPQVRLIYSRALASALLKHFSDVLSDAERVKLQRLQHNHDDLSQISWLYHLATELYDWQSDQDNALLANDVLPDTRPSSLYGSNATAAANAALFGGTQLSLSFGANEAVSTEVSSANYAQAPQGITTNVTPLKPVPAPAAIASGATPPQAAVQPSKATVQPPAASEAPATAAPYQQQQPTPSQPAQPQEAQASVQQLQQKLERTNNKSKILKYAQELAQALLTSFGQRLSKSERKKLQKIKQATAVNFSQNWLLDLTNNILQRAEQKPAEAPASAAVAEHIKEQPVSATSPEDATTPAPAPEHQSALESSVSTTVDDHDVLAAIFDDDADDIADTATYAPTANTARYSLSSPYTTSALTSGPSAASWYQQVEYSDVHNGIAKLCELLMQTQNRRIAGTYAQRLSHQLLEHGQLILTPIERERLQQQEQTPFLLLSREFLHKLTNKMLEWTAFYVKRIATPQNGITMSSNDTVTASLQELAAEFLSASPTQTTPQGIFELKNYTEARAQALAQIESHLQKKLQPHPEAISESEQRRLRLSVIIDLIAERRTVQDVLTLVYVQQLCSSLLEFYTTALSPRDRQLLKRAQQSKRHILSVTWLCSLARELLEKGAQTLLPQSHLAPAKRATDSASAQTTAANAAEPVLAPAPEAAFSAVVKTTVQRDISPEEEATQDKEQSSLAKLPPSDELRQLHLLAELVKTEQDDVRCQQYGHDLAVALLSFFSEYLQSSEQALLTLARDLNSVAVPPSLICETALKVIARQQQGIKPQEQEKAEHAQAQAAAAAAKHVATPAVATATMHSPTQGSYFGTWMRPQAPWAQPPQPQHQPQMSMREVAPARSVARIEQDMMEALPLFAATTIVEPPATSQPRLPSTQSPQITQSSHSQQSSQQVAVTLKPSSGIAPAISGLTWHNPAIKSKGTQVTPQPHAALTAPAPMHAAPQAAAGLSAPSAAALAPQAPQLPQTTPTGSTVHSGVSVLSTGTGHIPAAQQTAATLKDMGSSSSGSASAMMPPVSSGQTPAAPAAMRPVSSGHTAASAQAALFASDSALSTEPADKANDDFAELTPITAVASTTLDSNSLERVPSLSAPAAAAAPAHEEMLFSASAAELSPEPDLVQPPQSSAPHVADSTFAPPSNTAATPTAEQSASYYFESLWNATPQPEKPFSAPEELPPQANSSEHNAAQSSDYAYFTDDMLDAIVSNIRPQQKQHATPDPVVAKPRSTTGSSAGNKPASAATGTGNNSSTLTMMLQHQQQLLLQEATARLEKHFALGMPAPLSPFKERSQALAQDILTQYDSLLTASAKAVLQQAVQNGCSDMQLLLHMQDILVVLAQQS